MKRSQQTPRPDVLAPVEAIRAHFPALAREHHGKPVAYFDGPGGTQAPRQVVEAISNYLYHHNANTHWNYPTSIETDELIASARSAGADLLGASPTEVVFGPNMTTLAFAFARAFARTLRPGDEVVVTALDHDANIAPWLLAAQDAGARVHGVDFRPEDGTLWLEGLASVLTDRTRVVAFTLASNALGS